MANTLRQIPNIIASIRKHRPVSDASLERLLHHMERMELPKRHCLIRAGELCKFVYFIEKGFARSYILHEGEETTIWFSREGDITFAMQSLYHNEPGYENVELLEDSIIYAIHTDDLNDLYETNIEIANWSRVAHQECLLYMDRHHNNRLTLSAGERYKILLHEEPDIVRRARLSDIASYLGISQQHLSRLRASRDFF